MEKVDSDLAFALWQFSPTGSRRVEAEANLKIALPKFKIQVKIRNSLVYT